MNINQLNSQDLRKALDLMEQKEIHLAQIADIEQQLGALFGEEIAAPATRRAPGFKAPQPGKRGRKGHVKEAIIALLTKAGTRGVSLKEIGQKLGMNSNRLNTWLYTTGRKIKQIKKLQRGVYGWIE